MGIMDFVFGSGDKVKGTSDEEKSKELEGRVKDLDLGIDSMQVDLSGDTAVLKGEAKTLADREKAILAVGNTAGIAKVDDRLSVSGGDAGQSATFYTVQAGDSLSKIAKSQYGDATQYQKIFEANQPLLSDPDKIYPGQVLRIPPVS